MSPEHPHLEAVLDLIRDPEELWSPYGLRSLSLKDEFYGTDENYWRSPVWININYMVIQRLLVSIPCTFIQIPGPDHFIVSSSMLVPSRDSFFDCWPPRFLMLGVSSKASKD